MPARNRICLKVKKEPPYEPGDEGMNRAVPLMIGLSSLFITFIAGCQHAVRPNLATGASGPRMIEDVRVRGNNRVSTETIHANIQTKRGDRFSQAVITQDIQRLRSLGEFTDVHVEQTAGTNGGTIVVFDVRERRKP
jgi:outer membrane protein assembly factor BamA